MPAVPAAVPVPRISFFVRGAPQTQGSKNAWHHWRPNGRCIVRVAEVSGPKLQEWRALVATAAKRAMKQAPPFAGPVRVMAGFWFERPASHTRAQREDPFVHGAGRHDLDKTLRALLDSLAQAAVVKDDGQVAVLAAEKRYAVADIPAGVYVVVEALQLDEEPLFEGPP